MNYVPTGPYDRKVQGRGGLGIKSHVPWNVLGGPIMQNLKSTPTAINDI